MNQSGNKNSTVRIPPHDIDAEKAVLGSVMLDKETMHIVSDIVGADDFYDEKNGMVYQAMMDLYEKHEPIDYLTVTTRLKDKKLLKPIGGNAYVSELVNGVPTSSNAKHYAEIVRKKKVLRDLIDSSNFISQLGYAEGEEVEDVLDEAEQKIFKIARFSVQQKFESLKGALSEAWDRIDHLHKTKEEIRGVPTGFPDLDNLLAGFQKEDLIILAARPSMGKTALALDIARSVAKKNIPVGIFSLEMGTQQLVDRLLASEAMIDSWKLRTGKLSAAEEFERLSGAIDRLSQAPLFIDDQASNSVLQMRAMARRLQAEHGLGLIVVDYLQLINPRQKSENIVQQMTEISRSLKGLAKDLKVPVLALSQLSRAVESRQDKRPKLHDLRDSGSIEQDADVVMFIYRDEKYKDREAAYDPGAMHEAEILIEKHRNGPTGKVNLYFHPDKVTFRPVEKSDFGSL